LANQRYIYPSFLLPASALSKPLGARLASNREDNRTRKSTSATSPLPKGVSALFRKVLDGFSSSKLTAGSTGEGDLEGGRVCLNNKKDSSLFLKRERHGAFAIFRSLSYNAPTPTCQFAYPYRRGSNEVDRGQHTNLSQKGLFSGVSCHAP
jgi:hypothetical protein